MIVHNVSKHKKVIFNGDSYSSQWAEEAAKRGLCDFKTTVEALEHSLDEKNLKLFETHGVLSRREMKSRYGIHLENYSNIIHIESKTLISMVKSEILPAISKYTKVMAETVWAKKQLESDVLCDYEMDMLKKFTEISSELYSDIQKLYTLDSEISGISDSLERARGYRDKVIKLMKEIRGSINWVESCIPKEFWPYPTYEDILFSV